MSDLGQLITEAAATLPYWRDAAIAALAAIVIGALWLYATALEVK